MILLPWIVDIFNCFILYLCVFSSLCCTFLKKKKKSVRRFSLSFMNLKKKADSYVGFFLLHLAQKTYSVKPCSITSAKFPSNTDVKRVVLQLLTVPCPRKRVCLIWLGGLIRPVLIYRHRRATDCGVQQLPYQICVVSFICCLSRWQYSVTNVYPQTMNELFIKRKKTQAIQLWWWLSLFVLHRSIPLAPSCISVGEEVLFWNGKKKLIENRVVLLTGVTLLNVAILKHISINSKLHISYCKLTTTVREFIFIADDTLC